MKNSVREMLKRCLFFQGEDEDEEKEEVGNPKIINLTWKEEQ